MCDQTEIVYGDGEVVWVKLGPTWWPGQVLDQEKAPPEALNSLRKPPIAVVKFFKEEFLEFVKNYNQIYKYNCNRKHEFIKKGLDQYRAKHPRMELFPSYVCEAETLTHGDPDIIHSEEFKPAQKLDYNSIFSTGTEKKPKAKAISPQNEERTPKITHPRILQKILKGISDYKAHILVQEVRKESGDGEERMQLEAEEETMVPPPMPTPPRFSATPGPLICHACPFSCNRISVMVLHNKTHSAGYVPYTPPKRPKIRLTHSTPKIKLSSKAFSCQKSRGRPKKISLSASKSLSSTPKTVKSPVKTNSTVKRKAKEKEEEKPKTDVEIKNSLLADWSESSNDSFDILSSVNLCEKPKPAVSTPPLSPKSDTVDREQSPEIVEDDSSNKPSETKKADCFDFDDDDDELAIESISRKIPRLSTKSDETTKKIVDLNTDLLESNKMEAESVEDEKMEVDLDLKINDLLQETNLPELPALPTESKLHKAKSPSKGDTEEEDNKDISKPQQKTIFKTKTFFRSRHSRSQDAIEKYVADNTCVDKPPTYMEETEQLENPSDASPILTPPSKGSQNKTPKFAPKIQLKKLKAALNEQIKPQISKCSEDKWDDDSLEKLIGTSSTDDIVLTAPNTINDLLGTIEEPLSFSQTEISKVEIKEDPKGLPSPRKSDVKVAHKELSSPQKSEIKPVHKELSSPIKSEIKPVHKEVSSPHKSETKVSHKEVSSPHKSETKVSHKEVSSPHKSETKVSHKEVSSPHKSETKVSLKELSSPHSLDIKENRKSIDKRDTDNQSSSELENQSSILVGECIEKLQGEQNIFADQDNQTDVLPPTILDQPQSNSSTSDYTDNKLPKILSPTKKYEKKKVTESNQIFTSHDSKEFVTLDAEMEKNKNLDVAIKKSPRKTTDSKIAALIQSEMTTTSDFEKSIDSQNIALDNEKIILSPQTTRTDTLSLENTFDHNNTIAEAKSSDFIEREKVPTESDLQIAETLINLPTAGCVTPMEFAHNIDEIKMSECDQNISAAKSLVQMSEAMQHEQSLLVTTDSATVLHRESEEINVSSRKQSPSKPIITYKEKNIENTKLYKILDEPAKPKPSMKIISTKISENVSNVHLPSPVSTKPQVIIRKGPIQKEINQPHALPSPLKELQTKEDEILFDINSMPIVLSEEILTPENIQKMPIVVSDVQVTPKITQSYSQVKAERVVPKEAVKPSAVLSSEKVSTPVKKYGMEMKPTTVVKPMSDKSTTPNILSKSNKVKTVKHLLVVDKNSGEQKIITSESFEESTPVTITKVVKRSPAILSRGHKPGEKFIILPSSQSPKPLTMPPALTKITGTPTKMIPQITNPMIGKRTQKIILSPQMGSQVLLDNSSTVDKLKPTTTKAKIIQNRTNSEPTRNAVMIITNPGGVQSKIVLTPEHQKVLFSKKPGQLTLTTQAIPQMNTVANVQSPRAKPISVTSQSIITSRGQIINPVSGNALITSTGQLLPAQQTVTSSSTIISKQKGTIISSTKVIPPGERVIITGKPNQTILTSKGQLIMSQIAPTTSHSKMSTSTVISSSSISMPSVAQKTIIGKPKQQTLKMAMSTPTIIKSNSKLISGDLATLLQGKKPGTVMHLSAAQFEHLQKTGQIIQQRPLSQIIQTPKAKPNTHRMQSQKIIVQKQQTPTLKQFAPVQSFEKKITPLPKNVPSLIQTTKPNTIPPPKKQKLRELLTEPESNQIALQAKKKKTLMTYSSPKQALVQTKAAEQVMDLGNLDDLIPATTIATRKGEVHVSENAQKLVAEPVPETLPTNISSSIPDASAPSTSMQSQESIVQEDTTQASGGLGDGQLLAVPGENFGGPANSFYLCVEENGTLTPIDNQPLVLENNQLVPMVIPPVLPEFLNTEDQILVDQQTLLSLLGGSGGDRLVTGDNQQLLLQGDVRQLMAALTPQAAPNQDILAAALADTDVFQPDTLVQEGLGIVSGAGQSMLVEVDALGGEFQNLNAVTVNSNVSETSTTLKQPIMSPVEIPSKKRITEELPNTESLEDSLAVIGVTPPSVPTSLGLPITVTDPRIAPKTTNPLSLSCGPLYAPSTMVLSPTPPTLDAFSALIADHKAAEASITNSALTTVVSETIQRNSSVKKGVTSSGLDNFRNSKKQPASSMPCLDDSSSDSFVSDNPQQLTEAIQTKTYSPISMPLLTDDPPLPSDTTQSGDSSMSASQDINSMPVLLETVEIKSTSQETSSFGTNMPLLDDSQEGTQLNVIALEETKVPEISNVMTIPNSMVLPNEIFNENNTTNDEEESSSVLEQTCNSRQTILSDAIQEQSNHCSQPLEGEIQIPVENTEVHVSNDMIDASEEIVDQAPNEPIDGIPIIVTTEDGEPGGEIVDVDLDVAPPSVPSPAEGNSLPHTEGEEPFSDASSDASTEIPLQPLISVSRQSLSMGSNGDHEKRPVSPNPSESSPKRFKYDDER